MARTLKRGSSGSDVKTLQKNLKKLGYYSGAINGSFGAAVDAAVRKFQKACGIRIDGVVGTQTRAALSARLKKKKKSVKKKRASSLSGASGNAQGQWGGHTFTVSSDKIYSFTSLQIKSSSALETKSDNDTGNASRKNANPTEVTLTIPMNAFVGCDVKSEAMAFIGEADVGKSDYFYICGKKLLPCQLMLVDATVKNVDIAPNAGWRKADVSLTFKRSSGGGGSSGGKKKKGKSKKSSVRRSSPRGGYGGRGSGGRSSGGRNVASTKGKSGKKKKTNAASYIKKMVGQSARCARQARYYSAKAAALERNRK